MAGSHKVPVSCSIPYKTHQAVRKLMMDYGYSQSKMIEALISVGVDSMLEPIETTAAYDSGRKRAINNGVRRIL